MPEPLLHDLQRHAVGKQIAAVGVPEVMHGVHYGAGTMPNWFQCSTTFPLENLKKWTSLKVIRLPDAGTPKSSPRWVAVPVFQWPRSHLQKQCFESLPLGQESGQKDSPERVCWNRLARMRGWRNRR